MGKFPGSNFWKKVCKGGVKKRLSSTGNQRIRKKLSLSSSWEQISPRFFLSVCRREKGCCVLSLWLELSGDKAEKRCEKIGKKKKSLSTLVFLV